MTDLSTKKILFYDMGLFTCIAQKLGESFGKVYYYLPQSDPFPSSYIKDTGEGIEEFERIDDLWKVIDKVDAIIFIDCYDGEFQHWLKSKGYRVFRADAGSNSRNYKIRHNQICRRLSPRALPRQDNPV